MAHSAPTVGDLTALLEDWYPPRHAESWDAVGLVCGDPGAEVHRILLAVDPVAAVAQEAVETDADLLIAHHPLLLRGVHGVAATSPKGRLVHELISNDCALFTAHTNADSPAFGVSESMALALGLTELRPLDADPVEARDKLVVFMPPDAAEQVRAAITAAGAGAIGDYDSCTFSTDGTGRFRPLPGANPTVGSVGGGIEEVAEVRVEAISPRALRSKVLTAMRAAHPYEEPAYDVIALAASDAVDRGSGRIGQLAGPVTLRDFATTLARALPQTAHGVRVAGDPDQQVRTVALCGGAGDFLLDRARASGADVYVTSDLRHHPAGEAREHGDLALVDVAHWAAEWTWLPVLAARLRAALNERGLGDTVEVGVSEICTDPWTFRA